GLAEISFQTHNFKPGVLSVKPRQLEKSPVLAAIVNDDDFVILSQGLQHAVDFADQRFDVFFLVVYRDDYGKLHRLRCENPSTGQSAGSVPRSPATMPWSIVSRRSLPRQTTRPRSHTRWRGVFHVGSGLRSEP